MKLGYTILYVEDVKKTLQFYEKAFGLKTSFIHEGGDYGELETGETRLAFASYDLAESNGIGFSKSEIKKENSTMEIALVTDNVENAFKLAIETGAIEIQNPALKPWGQTVAYVRDINGFLVELCTPIQT